MRRIDSPVAKEFTVPVPTLPEGVASCKGIPRTSWFTKCVTLTNEAEAKVARGICHNVDVDHVIDMNGEPLGDDWIAIHIVESLCEEEVPLEWMWSMHSWYISRVYLNGASLYDYKQTHLYRATINGSRWCPRIRICSYESSQERREPNSLPKKEVLMTFQSINEILSKECCSKNCIQPFPHGWI